MAKTRVYHLANMAEVESDPGKLALLFGELALVKEPMGKRALANALAVNVNCSPSQLIACCEAGAFRVVLKNPLVELYLMELSTAQGLLYFKLRAELCAWCLEHQAQLTRFDFWPVNALKLIVSKRINNVLISAEIYQCLDALSWVGVRCPEDYAGRVSNLTEAKRQILALSGPKMVQEPLAVEG